MDSSLLLYETLDFKRAKCTLSNDIFVPTTFHNGVQIAFFRQKPLKEKCNTSFLPNESLFFSDLSQIELFLKNR